VKAPSLYQLYAPPSFGAPVGNKNLRPETNKTTEVGAKLKTENHDFVLTLFQNDLESQFTYVSGIGYRNQDHFIIQGVEANLTTYLTPGLRLQNSLTHQKFLAKDMPLRRPQNSAVSAIFWTPTEGLEIFWKERLISSRIDVDELGERVKLNPYQVSSLGGHWTQGTYEITLTVENVFDREYEDIYATTVMPLSFWSNLSYRF
jgi:outer membrane receptor protein involved in Fe transport